MQQHLTTATGVEAVSDVVSAYVVQPGPDGLELQSPDLSKWVGDKVHMTERLVTFLTDLRLLRRIPLSYLVPDADLLPPESIRFFHVDQTWVDRVVDGVFSTTTTGTVDFHYGLSLLQMLRDTIIPAPAGMTGMLIRSELVRRWPKLIVRAFASANAGVDDESTMTVLRAEPISRDVLIALFDGTPQRIHLGEPFEGVRFGVEGTAFPYEVDRRHPDGTLDDDDPDGPKVDVAARNASRRTIHVEALRDDLPASVEWTLKSSRGVALHLEQRPYVQVFLQGVGETEGSKPAPQDNKVALRNGKQFTLSFATQALFQGDD